MLEDTLGRPVNRVDGHLKITGRAKYAADQRPDRAALHGVLLKSSIASGHILSFDLAEAETMQGFVRFLSHLDGPLIQDMKARDVATFFPGETLTPFLSDEVYFAGQHVGLVLAETREVAEAAASAITVSYKDAPPSLSLNDERVAWQRPERYNTGEELQMVRGDVTAAKSDAAWVIERHFTTPAESHNPIETSATIADWDGETLVLHDATQGNSNSARCAAYAMGLPDDKVRVVNPFVGGGFGCKGFAWPHTLVAAAAARVVDAPVSLVLSRRDMYTSCGHRPTTDQKITLASDRDGRLLATQHHTRSYHSPVGDHVEPCGLTTAMLYSSPNLEVTHEIGALNLPSATPMRGPGEAPGTFALESAMDELAEALDLDPIEIRRRNHTDIDQRNGRKWSSKHLLRCYDEGAEKFGWQDRVKTPRARPENHEYVGFGMATACYPGYRMPARAQLTVTKTGRAEIKTGVQDIGTGAYTIIAQMVAQGLGISVEQVDVRLGDTALPEGPLAGGSMTTASVAAAVDAVIEALRTALVSYAGGPGPSNAPLMDQFLESGQEDLTVNGGSDVTLGFAGGQETDKSFYSFGAIFVEARVDRDYGIVRIPRMLGAFDAGRILNAKTARSQMIGGMTFGIGMALMEETEFGSDGRILNPSLGEYYVPINADVHQMDVHFIDEPDFAFNPMGARGIGELGCVGAAAAIANAVYNACGVRIRDLPIRLDKIMEGLAR
ncbi:xanthine dehydrogenase family protein molybdopterin-binding subunit [Aestuariibius sp. 2305UL40-4]|uniref:xanthine dehydrogenase family protein molybdopterin-binding subunit n=1 Tax=Aestuariibius violaceus TaxID=3234132 RepID=UPI00345E1A72